MQRKFSASNVLCMRRGICCVPAIFEHRRGRLGSKISGYGQLAEVAVYFAMSGLPPEADTNRKGRHVRSVPILLQKSDARDRVVWPFVRGGGFKPPALTLFTPLQLYAMHRTSAGGGRATNDASRRRF